MNKLKQDKLNRSLWKACEPFRKTVKPHLYRDHILAAYLIKFLSDRRQGPVEIDPIYDFNYIYNNRDSQDLGEILNKSLEGLRALNEDIIKDIFTQLDFESETYFGKKSSRNKMLKEMLKQLNLIDFKEYQMEDPSIYGNALVFLVENIEFQASNGDEDIVPDKIGDLMVGLLGQAKGASIYDFNCGIGNLLTKAFRSNGGGTLYGEVENQSLYMLTVINMILNGVYDFHISLNNSIEDPAFTRDNQLEKFNLILSRLPLDDRAWQKLYRTSDGKLATDRYGRFKYGIPSLSRPEFAYIQQLLASLEKEGTMVVLTIPSLLFRGGIEEAIRKRMLEENLIEAIISLPENLMPGTGVSFSLIIFKKNRDKEDILLIDGSDKDNIRMEKGLSIIKDELMDKIIEAYRDFKEVPNFSRIIDKDILAKNDYNLYVSRYFLANENIGDRDPGQVKNNILEIQLKLMEIEKRIESIVNKL